MTSRSMLTVQLPYSVYIVHSQMTHGYQGRSSYLQHGPCVTYINRIAIQQRLLVEFSCDPYIDSLLRALLVCVIIGLGVQWLSQQLSELKIINFIFILFLISFFFFIYLFIFRLSIRCYHDIIHNCHSYHISSHMCHSHKIWSQIT